MATFTGQAGTNNTFVGTATADLFRFAATDINSRDSVTGGGGTDRLQLTTARILDGTALSGVKGVEEIALADGTNGIKLINANFTGVTGSKIVVFGGRGNDRVDASTLTATNAIDVAAGAGLDVFLGGAGADTFRFAAAGLAGDTVVGGGGRDLLVLTSAGVVTAVQMAGVTGVETIQLAPGGNIITLGNANFAGVAGARIAVKIGVGNSSVVGEGLTGANAIDVTGGEGIDVITGGAGRDTFRFRHADLNGDTVRGSGGADLLQLTTGGALGAGALASMEAVETIRLAATGNTITLVDSNFDGVGGAQIRVLGGAGNDGVDGSALTGLNRIDVTAGAGNDVLKGGARADVFRFRALDLTSADRVIGGAGRDTLMLTTAGTITLAGVSGVETIRLANGTNALKLGNATVADGAAITVIGGSGNDTVDGSGLTGIRSIAVTAGAGLDVLKGGAGADRFVFAAADLAQDIVEGGGGDDGGDDTLQLTTAGTITAEELALVSGVEQIQLANGTNALTLTDANFLTAGGSKGISNLRVIGGSGNDTVDGSALARANSDLTIEAGGGLDVLRGGAGFDGFLFAASELDGDTIAGGGGNGTDTLIITQGGVLKVDALRNMTGVERIDLEQGSTTLTLVDAIFAGGSGLLEIRDLAAQGTNIIDAADLTGANGILVQANSGGSNQVSGGGGSDGVSFLNGAVFKAGDSFDGGDGVDIITIGGSMDFLGDTITNVEILRFGEFGAAAITISGENAAGLSEVMFGNNRTTQVLTVQLSAGSTTNLANLRLDNPDAADAINVVSLGGAGTSTSVTLSASIATFTGSAGNDTVSFAPGGGYKEDAVIDGGGGDDRIAFDASLVTLDGGTGNDTLVVRGSEEIDLRNVANQNPGLSSELSSVRNFENIDASASTARVMLVGHDDVFSRLIGGSGKDTITAGAGGGRITGGLGADVLTGSTLLDNFFIRSTLEAQGDRINGGGGTDTIFLRDNTDLTGAEISAIEHLSLFATDAVTGLGVARNLTVTLMGDQAEALQVINGNTTANTVETLVVNHSGGTLTLASLGFETWRSEDLVVINGTSGADTITGTSQNDVIDGGFGADTLSGSGGDDVIGYSQLSTQELNGGTGNDTIRLDNLAAPEVLAFNSVDLGDGTITETRSDGNSSVIFAREFENADFSANTIATTLIGNGSANVLIGGSADDQILGAGGADTLTGGDGADSFRWGDKAEGGDTITDFTRGTDKLVFEDLGFTFSGSTFNTVTFDSGSGTLNLNTTDLLIAGQTLESADDVRAFVNNNSTSTQHGMFVVATTTSGSRVLYYTSNASSSGADNAFFQIADLGEGPAPALSDFQFI